jgi:hypothetical protein
MSNKRQLWEELVNPFTTYERQALVDADLNLKPRGQQVTKSQMRELIKTITDAFCALARPSGRDRFIAPGYLHLHQATAA